MCNVSCSDVNLRLITCSISSRMQWWIEPRWYALVCLIRKPPSNPTAPALQQGLSSTACLRVDFVRVLRIGTQHCHRTKFGESLDQNRFLGLISHNLKDSSLSYPTHSAASGKHRKGCKWEQRNVLTLTVLDSVDVIDIVLDVKEQATEFQKNLEKQWSPSPAWVCFSQLDKS